MEHQDWTELRWDRSKDPKKILPSQKSSDDARHLQKIQQEDFVPTKTVDKQLGQKCTLARTQKGLTRKQLAQRLSIPENYIHDFETGGKKPTGTIMNKIINFMNQRKID